MDTKDILKATDSTRRLVQDEEYYRHIFKKTEKIVSVVFYIVYNLETNSRTQTQVEDILNSARAVHDAILQSLQMRTHVAEDTIRASAHALIALESKLRVAQVSGLISPEVMHVLAGEIDSVLRGMNKYLKSTNAFDDMEYRVGTTNDDAVTRPRSRATATTHKTLDTGSSSSPLDRRERIKTVLDAKGDSTIKDISEIITDCSEKTIQRELNSLIEDNVVKRQGERRWSKYSLL